MLKVSTVIPMYNARDTIIRTLNSVLDQTYPIDEIIVVNDGSTDDSLAVVEGFISAKNLHEVIKMVDKVNGGVSTARNVGIRTARNEYIATCDSDDVWLPQKIELEMDVFKKYPHASLVGSRVGHNKMMNFFWIKFQEVTRITYKMELFKNFFSPSAIIFRKSHMLETLPNMFPEDQRFAEEGLVFLFLSKYRSCYLFNEKLAIFGDDKPMFGHSGLSSNLKGMHQGELRNFKKIYQDGNLNFIVYLAALIYSYAKYFRRILIVRTRR